MRLKIRCPVVAAAFLLLSAVAAKGAVFGHLHINSAETDSPQGSFREVHSRLPEPSGKVMYLKVGHVHEISVEGKFDSFEWSVSNPKVASVDPTGRTVHVTGVGLGETEVIVRTMREGHLETDGLIIRGISRRYTIIGWLDGQLIIPDNLAPSANHHLKEHLNNAALCSYLVGIRWYAWGSRTYLNTEADKLYAKAFLLNSASNPIPPNEIGDDFPARVKEYKLYNDYEVDENGSVIHSALMGQTPLPCGVLPGSVKGDYHSDNDHVFWNEKRTELMHLNEARIGEQARKIERLIDPQSGGVGWIWSIGAFDKKGAIGVSTQAFPSFWVYRDGVVCGKRKQEDLARFLKASRMSEVTEHDASRLRPEDLEDACTDQLR